MDLMESLSVDTYCLENLQRLILGRNKLMSISNKIGGLPELKTLSRYQHMERSKFLRQGNFSIFIILT